MQKNEGILQGSWAILDQGFAILGGQPHYRVLSWKQPLPDSQLRAFLHQLRCPSGLKGNAWLFGAAPPTEPAKTSPI